MILPPASKIILSSLPSDKAFSYLCTASKTRAISTSQTCLLSDKNYPKGSPGSHVFRLRLRFSHWSSWINSLLSYFGGGVSCMIGKYSTTESHSQNTNASQLITMSVCLLVCLSIMSYSFCFSEDSEYKYKLYSHVA